MFTGTRTQNSIQLHARAIGYHAALLVLGAVQHSLVHDMHGDCWDNNNNNN